MKYRTEVVREGELLGPVDWSHNFRQHFDGYCCSEQRKDEFCERAKDFLRQIERDPASVRVTLNGQFDKEVLAVGMYDGWPFWKPTPALLTTGSLGPEWHFFYDVTAVSAKVGSGS